MCNTDCSQIKETQSTIILANLNTSRRIKSKASRKTIRKKAMEAPFRAVFLTDLPDAWQKTPEPEIQLARAKMLGIPPEQMVRRIVFCVPEHPIFIEYEKFLQSVIVPQNQEIVSCVIQNAETWKAQSKPKAFKNLMTSMRETGAPDFNSLGCAEYKNPLPTVTPQ